MEIEQKLNEILATLIKFDGIISRVETIEKEKRYPELIERLNIDKDEEGFLELCDILSDAKYINYFRFKNDRLLPFANRFSYMKITLKGRLFMKSNGYVGQLERMESNSAAERRNEKYLRNGAIWAAIGTISYLIWDILKYCMEHVWCNCP